MKRKITGILTICIALSILLTGTLAWVNFSQHMLNEFNGDTGTTGGTGHDDFDEPKKDVYVENWGDNNIYVRIRLDEYMEIGDGAGLKGSFEEGIWVPNPGNNADSLIDAANINDMATWTPHIPDGAAEICDTPADFHDYWEWAMGGQKIYKPAPEEDRTDPSYVDQNTEVYTSLGDEPGLKETLDATVITMEEWHELGKPIGPYWVIDADGWAYWAAPLKPGTATGLLLNSVDKLFDDEFAYYYAINVIVQMATKYGDLNYTEFFSDSEDSERSATGDGQELLEIITGSEGKGTIEATGVTISGGDKSISIGQSYTPGCVIEPEDSTDKAVWSSDDDGIATVSKNGKIKGISEGEVTITVTVGGYTDSITITVTPAEASVIPTKLGVGPYDTEYDDDEIDANYALICKGKASPFSADAMRESIGEIETGQEGSIKLSNIFGTHSYEGVDVEADDPLLSEYFYIGVDKDGNDALMYNYIPGKSLWDAAIPGTPTQTIDLILTKAGFEDTPIKVIVRYNMSLYGG